LRFDAAGVVMKAPWAVGRGALAARPVARR
jgi:hypothetical protein